MNFWVPISLIISAHAILISGQCDDIQTQISTNRTKEAGDAFMTYVGDTESTFIQCSLTCESCTVDYLYWIQDARLVYGKWFIEGRTTGPEPGFETRVNPDLIEVVSGKTYVLEWNQTLWSDLPTGSASTNWECFFELGACGTPADNKDIEYFRRPLLLACYINGELLTDCSDLMLTTSNNTFNCSVISHPESNVTLWQQDIIISNQSSCSPYSEHEHVCSLSVSDIDLSEGFHGTADYDSPETGKVETIEFIACYPDTPAPTPTLTPTPPEGGFDPEGLEGWAVGLIVVASVAVVGGTVAGAVYFVKVKKKT